MGNINKIISLFLMYDDVRIVYRTFDLSSRSVSSTNNSCFSESVEPLRNDSAAKAVILRKELREAAKKILH